MMALLVACLLALLPACASHAQSVLSIYVIDVGQGDSTLVLGPDQGGRRTSLLIDAGDNRFTNGAEIVGEVLRNVGVTSLDHVILTHYDADHMGGFVTIGNGTESLLWTRQGPIANPVCTATGLFPTQSIFDVGQPVGSSQSRREWRACADQLTGAVGQAVHVEIDGQNDVDRAIDLGGGTEARIAARDLKRIGGRSEVVGHAELVAREADENLLVREVPSSNLGAPTS